MLLLFGCWQPGEYIPPVPENLALVAGSAPSAASAEEAAEPAAEEAGTAEAAPDVADPAAPEAPEAAPEAPPMQPYAGQTVGAPLTLVDDVGKIVQVLAIPKMEVMVLAEEPPVRKKVRCTACTPEVEGWLQFANVERK